MLVVTAGVLPLLVCGGSVAVRHATARRFWSLALAGPLLCTAFIAAAFARDLPRALGAAVYVLLPCLPALMLVRTRLIQRTGPLAYIVAGATYFSLWLYAQDLARLPWAR